MDEVFIQQLLGTAFGAGLGGFAAWVAIKVDVALAKQTAELAALSAKESHERIDTHIEAHHTIKRH